MSGEISYTEDEVKELVEFTEAHGEPIAFGFDKHPYNAVLRRRRQELGLTQKEISILVGSQIFYCAQVETYLLHPVLQKAQAIAEALDEKPEKLFPPYLSLYSRNQKAPQWEEQEVAESLVDHQQFKQALQTEVDQSYERVIAEVNTADLRECLLQVLGTINPRYAEIVKSRFGLEDREPATLGQLAQEFGISKERVRQLEAVGLRDLRKAGQSTSYLKEYKPEWLDKERKVDIVIEVLMNGAVNALYLNEWDRAKKNLQRARQLARSQLSPAFFQLFSQIRSRYNCYHWNSLQVDRLIDSYFSKKIRWGYYSNQDDFHFALRRLREIYILHSQLQEKTIGIIESQQGSPQKTAD